MQTVRPFPMFTGQAEEAMTFDTPVFERSEIRRITRYGADGGGARNA